MKPMETEVVVPESKCPSCRHVFDRASIVAGEGDPEPGDLSLCIGCGAYLKFGAQLEMLTVSLEEIPAALRATMWRVSAEIIRMRSTRCRNCGCSEKRACPGGCAWASVNLCTACAK